MNEIESINDLIDKWGLAVLEYLPKIFLATVTVIAFYLAAKILKKYSLKFYARVFENTYQVATVLSMALYVFLLLSGGFIALEILGLESVLSKLLAGAGVVGIVAGFAFKDIASNAFAGFLLSTHRPFTIGDWVSIDSEFGTIQTIGLITTSMKSIAGQEVFVPNQIIYNNSFTNYSAFGKRRVILSCGVSYGDDLDFVKKVSLEEVGKIRSLLKTDAVDFYFTEIGASTFNFEIRFWIKYDDQKDYLSAKSEIIMRLKTRFEEEGVSIAYSVITLDFGVKGGVNIFDKELKLSTATNK